MGSETVRWIWKSVKCGGYGGTGAKKVYGGVFFFFLAPDF